MKNNKLMSKGYTYVSFPVSWLDDRTVGQLSHEAMGAYLRLYLLAGRYNQAGALVDERGALELSDLAYLLRCSQNELQRIMELLELRGLMRNVNGAWCVVAFTDEQIDLNERREQARARVN